MLITSNIWHLGGGSLNINLHKCYEESLAFSKKTKDPCQQ